ncbi:MAG: mechanosensitive ion channel family protein [Wenzhouxiangellaceae bacterium]
MFETWMQQLGELTGLKTWMVQAFVILLVALLLEWLMRGVLSRLEKLVNRTTNVWDDALVVSLRRPLSALIWWLGVTTAARVVVPLAEDNLLFQPELLITLQQLGIGLALAWYGLRLTGQVEERMIGRLDSDHSRLDTTTIHAIARVVRIAIGLTAVLIVLDTLGVSISGLLAAGGIGGLALGLAAKDLLANFFGGFTIFMDRPFALGDWIRSPEKDIEGVVEKIGWRQTTIRRFNKRPLYVPNAIFTTLTVENPSRMTHRRINEVIGVRYDDIAEMRSITRAVDDLLRNHEDIAHDQIIMARFDTFAASSLNFFIYCMTRTCDWAEYHKVKEDVLLQIADIITEHGAEIAYPTSRLLLEDQPGAEVLNPSEHNQETEAESSSDDRGSNTDGAVTKGEHEDAGKTDS